MVYLKMNQVNAKIKLVVTLRTRVFRFRYGRIYILLVIVSQADIYDEDSRKLFPEYFINSKIICSFLYMGLQSNN
jgi:hypothetical protein